MQGAKKIELSALFAEGRGVAADVFDHAREFGIFCGDAGAGAPSGEERVVPLFATAGGGPVWGECDETGEVLIFGAEAVKDPGAHAGADARELAGGHDELGGLVHGGFGVHGADDAEFVGVGGEFWKQLTDIHSGLAMLCEGESGALEFAGESAHAGGGLAGIFLVLFEDFVDEAPVIFFERGFGVEGIDLRGAAFAEDVDDAFGFRRKVRVFGGEWGGFGVLVLGGVGGAILIEEGGEAECTDAEGASGKDVPSGSEGRLLATESVEHGARGLFFEISAMRARV